MQAIHATTPKHLHAPISACDNLMGQIVPVVVDIMMAHPEAAWGEACYPVVN